MSRRLLWDGVEVVQITDADYIAMSALVKRDARLYFSQIGNVIATVGRAGVPALCISSAGVCAVLTSAGLVVPRAISIIMKTVLLDANATTEMASFVLGGIALVTLGTGLIRALTNPRRFGYENKFYKAIIDRMGRRYACSGAGTAADRENTVIRG